MSIHLPLIFLNLVAWYEMPLFAEFVGLSTMSLCRMHVIVSALKPRGYGRICMDDIIRGLLKVLLSRWCKILCCSVVTSRAYIKVSRIGRKFPIGSIWGLSAPIDL